MQILVPLYEVNTYCFYVRALLVKLIPLESFANFSDLQVIYVNIIEKITIKSYKYTVLIWHINYFNFNYYFFIQLVNVSFISCFRGMLTMSLINIVLNKCY